MNELTKLLVTETAHKNKSVVLKEHYALFEHLVNCRYVDWLIATHGWQFKQRAVDLFRQWHPEIYDGEFIQDYHSSGFDLDCCLSELAMRCLWRKVDRDPKLQLGSDWGDLALRTAKPQMEMF